MKFLKGLGITILAIIVIYLLLAVFSPSTYSVTRDITFDAPKEDVWNQISSFEKWQAWSPWSKNDSTMVITYEGTEGTIGSKSNWQGNSESGKGNMTINEIIENEKIGYDLELIEPWPGTSKGYLQVSEADGKSTVTWSDAGPVPFLMRPMGMFGMFEMMMGPMFEMGLEGIATQAKQNPVSTSTPIEVAQIDFPATNYFGIRHKTTMSEVTSQEFFATNYGKIVPAISANNMEIAGNSSCIYYSWEYADSSTEAFPCFPIAATETAAPEGMEIVSIPGCKSVKATFTGPFSGAMNAHNAIGKYCDENNIKTGMVIEEYVNAATAESEEDYITNIYYLVMEE